MYDEIVVLINEHGWCRTAKSVHAKGSMGAFAKFRGRAAVRINLKNRQWVTLIDAQQSTIMFKGQPVFLTGRNRYRRRHQYSERIIAQKHAIEMITRKLALRCHE